MGDRRAHVDQGQHQVLQQHRHGPMEEHRVVPEQLVAHDRDLDEARPQPEVDVATPPVEGRDDPTHTHQEDEVAQQTEGEVLLHELHGVPRVLAYAPFAALLLLRTLLAVQEALEKGRIQRRQRWLAGRLTPDQSGREHAHAQAAVGEPVQSHDTRRNDGHSQHAGCNSRVNMQTG